MMDDIAAEVKLSGFYIRVSEKIVKFVRLSL